MTSAFDNLIAGLNVRTDTVQAVAPVLPNIKPVDLALPLLDFQQEAVAHALRDTQNKPYAYVGLDMGLGKTPVATAIAASLVASGIRGVLIVVPPSMRLTWQRELVKFAPWLSMSFLVGSKPEVGQRLPNVDVLVIGDSQLSGWADYLTGKIGALVVDEAHRFKNQNKRSGALVQLATCIKKTKVTLPDGRKKTDKLVMSTNLPKMRVLMSGTPTPNGRHAELAPQIEVLGKEAWRDIGGVGIFWSYYAPKVDAWGGRGSEDGESLYRAMVGSWFFRRLRDDVLDLPNKGRTPIALEAKGKAIKDYIAAEEDLIEFLKGKQNGQITEGQRKSKALIQMNLLRHLAGVCKIKSAIEHVKEILDEEEGGVFVVCEHHDVMDEITMALLDYNPVTVQGGMTDDDKQYSIDEFTSGRSRVLVGQVTAAGVGLTLHGGGKNHRVVVAQLPWTPADLKQAEDRLHRIGQTHDVLVEVALCAIEGKWTIDERLWGLLETKNFSASTVNDGEGVYLLDDIVEGVLATYRT